MDLKPQVGIDGSITMNKDEPILIACEESGAVTGEFIKLGYTNVFSCDMMKTSGDYPNHHIVGDVVPILNGNCSFKTSDGIEHRIDTEFSLIIAFPPCTHLAVSGAAWFEKKRADGRQQEGIDFFMLFTDLKCPKVVIENPIGIMSSIWKEPTQIIQPYWFGDCFQKSTCLWIKGLQPLEPTNMVSKGDFIKWTDKKTGKTKQQAKWFADAWKLPKEERAKVRSATFPGVAKAMAQQWGDSNWKPQQISLDELIKKDCTN